MDCYDLHYDVSLALAGGAAAAADTVLRLGVLQSQAGDCET